MSIAALAFEPEPEQLLRIPRSAHTLAGFRAWAGTLPEKTRVTFLDGEVLLDVSKEDIETHVKVKGEIFATLYQLNREIQFGTILQDGVLVTCADAKVSNNPDAVGVSWKSLESKKARIVEQGGKHLELDGTPDWVLEVVSPTSVAKDTKQLKAAYHAAKIAEYWLVDARRDEIVFTIFTWRKSGYVAVAEKDGWTASKVFGRSFQLKRQPDRLGQWEYRLAIREPD